MTKPLADQLKAWAMTTTPTLLLAPPPAGRGPGAPPLPKKAPIPAAPPPAQAPPARPAPPPGANMSHRVYARDNSYEFRVPESLVEAEIRLRECDASLAHIDDQLAAKASADFPTDLDYEAWTKRARAARRGYEYERARMATAVAVFREDLRAAEAAANKERDATLEACRRLSDEVARLGAQLIDARAANRHAGINAAFVEVAQGELAAVTFERLMARAHVRLEPT